MREVNRPDLSDQQLHDLQVAEMARGKGYNPYSDFQVGSAIRTVRGGLAYGWNVENKAYGSTICAERGAIMRLEPEARESGIKRVTVIGGPKDAEKFEQVPPCGACLQMIAEFAGPDAEILIAGIHNDIVKIGVLSEFLPHAFSNIGKDE